jgi:hypothetical protein
MRRRRSQRVALVIALAGAIAATADVREARAAGRHRRFDEAPVSVTSPLPSAPLRAFETVVVAWEPLPELERHEGFEEWEAFLSLDDGERYPVRLTPHLDLAQRSFAVTLPRFAAKRARLLLRFGDEREEFEYEVPGEFEILAARRLDAEPVNLARGRGELARRDDPSDAGVIVWVEGSRRGEATRTVVAAPSGASFEAVESQGWIAFRYATAAPASPQIAAAEFSDHPSPAPFVSISTDPPALPRGATIEPRRSTCRQNE